MPRGNRPRGDRVKPLRSMIFLPRNSRNFEMLSLVVPIGTGRACSGSDKILLHRSVLWERENPGRPMAAVPFRSLFTTMVRAARLRKRRHQRCCRWRRTIAQRLPLQPLPIFSRSRDVSHRAVIYELFKPQRGIRIHRRDTGCSQRRV